MTNNHFESHPTVSASQSRKCGCKTMPWVPRLWHGMTFSAWLSLLRENEFDIAPSRWPLAISVSAASVVNSVLSGATIAAVPSPH